MTLWTIQPEQVYRDILKTGTYICDPARMSMPELAESYDWLAAQMAWRIGPPPEGIKYPVWAWYAQDFQRKKPDLRRERWANGADGEKLACIEIEVPEEQVVLTDFDNWHAVLNHWLISDTEEEDRELEAVYNRLSPEDRRNMMEENWKRVFDITPLENGWTIRGSWIQATFWVLTKDMIRDVRFFTAAAKTGTRPAPPPV